MLINKIVEKIKNVLPLSNNPIGLHEPYFIGNEWNYTKECLDTGWVSSVGKFVDRFEKDLASYTGAKHVVVTTNGTAALHMSLLLAGVKPEDEVLVPALTFVATCNAIHYCHATPHFVDSERTSLGVDPVKLSNYLKDIAEIKNNVCYNRITSKPIRVLCVMHVFGHPVDIDPLVEIANQYNLILIEDAAEALGSYYKNQHVGHRGLLGTLSFNGNKIVTTGGGGAILTNDDAIAKKAKHLTTTAKAPHPWLYHHDEVGYNYRLPNINSALGCAQLEKLDDYLKAKRLLAEKYQKEFSALEEASFLVEPDYAKSNYWLNAILLNEKISNHRDDILRELNQQKIGVRPAWELMHYLPMYQHCPRMDLSTAENIASRLINIPSSVYLGMSLLKTQKSLCETV